MVGTAHTVTMQSDDPERDNLRYGIDWDNNDSVDQRVPPSDYVPSSTSQSASRTYSIAGTKTVKVLAQDEGGLTSSWATLSFDCAASATAGLDDNGNTTLTGDTGSGNYLPPAVTLDIRAVPSLLRQGATTKVSWSAQNVRSCTVLGDNGDSWSGLQSPIGGETSTPIQGQTTYTLSCLDLEGASQTKQATVNIIPTFQEL